MDKKTEIAKQRAQLTPEQRALLEKRLRGERPGQGAAEGLVRREGEPLAPLSFSQQRLWVLQRLAPESGALLLPTGVRLRGRLQWEALERAVTELVRRHEALRTTFEEKEEQPRQRVHPPAPVPLPLVDLSGLPGAERQGAVERLLREEGRRPFPPLEQGPLFRVTLARLAPEEHLLVFCVHHLVCDGWSMAVLVREVGALYGAYATGAAPGLPALPVQYGDFARWQRATLKGERLERDLAWWKARLAGVPALLELPTDRPRPRNPTRASARTVLPVAPALAARLEALARREGVSLFMVLLASFQTLLHRYSHQTDIVVGAPIANRSRPELEGLVGLFINTLALRTDLSGEPTFRQLLQRVRDVTLGAYAHQELPFELLVEHVRPERRLDVTPLFQVMLALQNVPAAAQGLQLAGVHTSPVEVDPGTSQYDVTLAFSQGPEGLGAVVDYSTELFDASSIERLGAHLTRLWEAVVEDVDRRIGELPLMSAEEQQCTRAWNDSAHPFPTEACIHGLFEAQVARTPEAVALVDGTRQLTYRELDRWANRIAHVLRERGVGPDRVVALCQERSAALVASMLGVLKAGGAYLPLDPESPTERLALVVQDARPVVLLASAGQASRLEGMDVPVLLPPAPGDSPGDDVAPRSGVTSAHLAYVIYTSGSSGQPKGVMLEHQGACNELLWRIQTIALHGGDCLLHTIPFHFDPSVWQLFGPLLAGARVVVARVQGVIDTDYLRQQVAAHHVTIVDFFPSVLQLFLQERLVAELSTVRQVFCGGEVLPPEVQERFFAQAPAARLFNQYGPTEATIDATYWDCQRGGAPRVVPIGRPIFNKQVHVLDRALAPVPVGVAGEIFIGGVGLARGYLGRPDMTAASFIPSPFEPGARLYRSGDLGRRLPDGSLEFLGRVDHQLKIRGVRIEPAEIESALRTHPGVRAAVVTARAPEGRADDRRLVAYVVPQPSEHPTGRDLRRYLKERLPSHLVPGVLMVLEALPTTPSGKVDLRALPEPEWGTEARQAPPPLRGPVQEAVAEVWRALLACEALGPEDDFFELGGHSLMAARVVSRLRERLGVELPLRSLFESPTVAGLAAQVELLRAGRGASGAPALEAVPRTGALPVSFEQERLLRVVEAEPGSSASLIALALRLEGVLDTAALEAALTALVARHEPLRTAFHRTAQGWEQRIGPARAFPLPVEDVGPLPPEAREALVQRRLEEEAGRAFDLEHGLLLRATLLRLEAREHLLLLTVHRLAADGASMGVLERDLAALYLSATSKVEAALPALPLQHADFATWERRWLRGEVLEAGVRYWKEQLAGAPAVPHPGHSRRGRRCTLALGTGLLNSLRALGRDEGTTLFMTLLAGYVALLARRSGQEDVVVGAPLKNRPRPELDEGVGRFVNMLALRARVAPELSFRELLGRVRQATLQAYEYQELPLLALLEALGPGQSLRGASLFQATFNLVSHPPAGSELPGLRVHPLLRGETAADFPLALSADEWPDALRFTLLYDADLFEPAAAEALLRQLRDVLESAAASPWRKLVDLRG